MREIVDRLSNWDREGVPYAVATVIAVSGSAPRLPGAAMAVCADGEAVGSVSGGCVEGAVYELCREVLDTGEPRREAFGYGDSDAFAVGLTCGGVVEVFVRLGPPRAVLAAIASNTAVAGVTMLDDSGQSLAVLSSSTVGTTGVAEIDAVVVGEALAMLDSGGTDIRSVRCRPDLEMFVQSYATAPRLLIFGAIDYAGSLARIGKFLGYHVTVCDARPVFATATRFPDADEVVVEWPHRYMARTVVDARTVICVLTHDPKFDVPLLEVALRLPVAFVGAMGSRRTHADRTARLQKVGLTEVELSRLRSPIGLDLGARTPEETALAIAAEFVAARRGGSGVPLTRTAGPIHRAVPPVLVPESNTAKQPLTLPASIRSTL
ncbi:xanthine dehydrogenase [Rhodococcus sp. 05-340-1]|uniref:XdhC family protein n=1 Tax=unclassified Rhodococcus (in: high G+C Gram-positive bacteria) TaxID=192944 RepID=UPI000B9B105A|nr:MULTISPECIES: XdhC family protein [unclassified Rhodococcus (in: high G+C Gram-positive bacteria)]OZD66974.1 xanthine dehydrogenase [Rhodococcus sp. 05-340-2]OZD81051.1 xanthine dehydrogenase [Rhodococcus sp. 05-340-1]